MGNCFKKLSNKVLLLKMGGFTLAEVLIVVGIIGLIATFGIVPLIKNYQKQVTVTQLQKMFNTICEAHKMAEVENGPSGSWGNPTTEWDYDATIAWLDKYFLPYGKLNISKTCSGANTNDCWAKNATFLEGTPIPSNNWCAYTLILNDGTTIALEGVTNNYVLIYVDVNGLKGPNIMGKDIFVIDLNYRAGYVSFHGKGASRLYLLGDNGNSCNKSPGSAKGFNCGALIQMDGWKISSEYPWD